MDQEAERLAALRSLDVLDRPGDERFDLVVRLVSRLLGAPMASIGFIDDERHYNLAAVGLPRELDRERSFCSVTVGIDDDLVVGDTLADPRFADWEDVAGGLGLRAYAGVPLRAPGGQAVGALCVIDQRPRTFDPDELAILHDLARWVDREVARDRDLERAADVQRRLLPDLPLDVPGWDMAGRIQMLGEVGGDFFDWHDAPHPDGPGFQVVVGDVMGKGVGAAMLASSVRAVLRGASRFNDVATALERSSYALDRDFSQTRSFVTLSAVRVDPTSGSVAYADAGHGLSAIVSPDGSHRMLLSSGVPMGVLGTAEWTVHHDRLAPGDSLVWITDGLLDHFPSTAATLEATVRSTARARTAREAVNRILALARGEAEDDLTAVVLRRAPEQEADA